MRNRNGINTQVEMESHEAVRNDYVEEQWMRERHECVREIETSNNLISKEYIITNGNYRTPLSLEVKQIKDKINIPV